MSHVRAGIFFATTIADLAVRYRLPSASVLRSFAEAAQREMATALETALDARRQRIIISQSQVNLLKWLCLFIQAVCTLVAIATVHSDNRLVSIIALGIFATGIAASMLLILAHDRPFTGEISIRPDPWLQVMPKIGS